MMNNLMRSMSPSGGVYQSPPRIKARREREREISLTQCIEPGRRMMWSEIDISFRHEDHPETELSNWNLPFVVKLLIG
jgi:hypothetical protein